MKQNQVRNITLFGCLILMLSLTAAPEAQSQTTTTPLVVINEVAWSGTEASSTDEWIELHNNSNVDINLDGWTLSWGDEANRRVIHFVEDQENSSTQEVRSVVIRARSQYLLERTDDDTIRDIEADLIYTGTLRNAGESLELRNVDGELISTANSEGSDWPAGTTDGDVPFASMERINSELADASSNWASNNGITRNGRDADGNLINGTPKANNSRSN